MPWISANFTATQPQVKSNEGRIREVRLDPDHLISCSAPPRPAAPAAAGWLAGLARAGVAVIAFRSLTAAQ